MNTNNENSTEKQSAGLFTFLKKILTWKRITGIITILSLILAIWVNWPEPEVEIVKNNIRNNIAIIERDFHPDELLKSSDSSLYVKKIAEFQRSALDYCALWQTLENEKKYKDYSDLDLETVGSIVTVDFQRIERVENVGIETVKQLKSICEYENELCSDASKCTVLSVSKANDINKYQLLKDDLERKCEGDFVDKYNKYIQRSKYYQNEFLSSALEEIDDMKNNADFYKVDNALLDFFIESNKLLMISIRYFPQME